MLIDQRQSVPQQRQKCLVMDGKRRRLWKMKNGRCFARQLFPDWSLKNQETTAHLSVSRYESHALCWRKRDFFRFFRFPMKNVWPYIDRCWTIPKKLTPEKHHEINEIEDRGSRKIRKLLFACCADIGCQNTNNQYSRRRCYDGTWDLVVLINR